MTDETEKPPKPGRNTAGEATRKERDARLAKALRDNLAKRKAQSRARGDGSPDPKAES